MELGVDEDDQDLGGGQDEFEEAGAVVEEYVQTVGTATSPIKTEVVETVINDATVDHVTQRELQEAVHNISQHTVPAAVASTSAVQHHHRQVTSVKIVKTKSPAAAKKKAATRAPTSGAPAAAAASTDNKPKQMFVYKLSR